MIFLTKLDGTSFMLNDEMIVLENGHSFIVRESMKEIQSLILENTRNHRRARLHRPNDEPLT